MIYGRGLRGLARHPMARHTSAMTTSHAAAAALIASLLSTPLAAAPMEPNGKWTVDFGDAHCIAMRKYGSKDRPYYMAFKPSPIGDVMQFSVMRPGGRQLIEQYPGTLTIGDAKPSDVSMLVFRTPGRQRMYVVNMTRAAFAPIRTAPSVRLRSPVEIDVNFALSSIGSVAQQLDVCTENLRKAWNIADAANQIGQEARALQPLASLFRPEAYPWVAIMARTGGTVETMLLIDEAGKIASCMVTATSGTASLDAQTCAILADKARFSPALDKLGKPTKSGMINRIRWQVSR